jgi:hypothetical protein
MEIKEAVEICEEYGWEVIKGKWYLKDENTDSACVFDTDKELIEYAKELKRNR